MKMSGKEFLNQVKWILKRVPVVQRLLNLKSEINNKTYRIRELSDLIKENRIVIFPSHSGMGNDVALTREMVHEVVKEWLDLYGIVHTGRTTAAAIDSPARAILLYTPMRCLEFLPHMRNT